MSNRRKLKTALAITAAVAKQQPRRPWNKGLALTRNPSLSTVRRWLEAGVAEGIIDRQPMPTGKPGRPPIFYRISEKGLEQARERPQVPAKLRMEQHRRWLNARKRRLDQRKAAATRELRHAESDLRIAERQLRELEIRRDAAAERLAGLEAVAEMLYDASTALDRAGYDPSVLLPEEIDVLTEHGCVAPDGDRLYFTRDWAGAYAEARGGGIQPVPATA